MEIHEGAYLESTSNEPSRLYFTVSYKVGRASLTDILKRARGGEKVEIEIMKFKVKPFMNVDRLNLDYIYHSELEKCGYQYYTVVNQTSASIVFTYDSNKCPFEWEGWMTALVVICGILIIAGAVVGVVFALNKAGAIHLFKK